MGIYKTSKNEQYGLNEVEDGMSYLWTWLHAMFGPKNMIYRDKQVSTIYHDGNILIGDQCAIPPVQKRQNRKQREIKMYGAYQRIILFEYGMTLAILLFILFILCIHKRTTTE